MRCGELLATSTGQNRTPVERSYHTPTGGQGKNAPLWCQSAAWLPAQREQRLREELNPTPAATAIGEPLSSVELQGVNVRDEKKGEELRGWRWERGGLSGRRR